MFLKNTYHQHKPYKKIKKWKNDTREDLVQYQEYHKDIKSNQGNQSN
jgi:hypothetical protein